MKSAMRFRFQAIVVLYAVVLSTADEDYENKLSKLWSVSGVATSNGSEVINSGGSVVIQPSRSSSNPEARQMDRYAFKPRAIPLRTSKPASQGERNAYYSPDNARYKPEPLFPGNYFRIAKEKSTENITRKSRSTVDNETFHPKSIPLIRSQESQKRSLDVNSEPIIEKPEDFVEQTASRRSISYIFGEDLDDEEEDRDDDLEADDEDDRKEGFKSKIKTPKIKKHKIKKYVLPLLLAYKMKYFALVPVMIGGLILLVGATGLAGFFFALFAAVMGLQKGGY